MTDEAEEQSAPSRPADVAGAEARLRRIDAMAGRLNLDPARRRALDHAGFRVALRAGALAEAERRYRFLALDRDTGPDGLVEHVVRLGDLAIAQDDTPALHRARVELARLLADARESGLDVGRGRGAWRDRARMLEAWSGRTA